MSRLDPFRHDFVDRLLTFVSSCSPALVANLWDVTDKDIDKLSENVFRLLGLDSADASSTATTLAGAVAQSRDVPLLKFLNGAACVVYGVPVLVRVILNTVEACSLMNNIAPRSSPKRSFDSLARLLPRATS